MPVARSLFSIAHYQGAADYDENHPEGLRDAEVGPRAEDAKGVEHEARYQLGRYHEREGACNAGLASGDGDGADDHGTQDARGQRVDYRATRELGPCHEKRDHQGASPGREARDRDQDRGAQSALGRPRQARLDSDAHTRQKREDEGGSHTFSLRVVVSPWRPDRDARRIIRGRRPFLRNGSWVNMWVFLLQSSRLKHGG